MRFDFNFVHVARSYFGEFTTCFKALISRNGRYERLRFSERRELFLLLLFISNLLTFDLSAQNLSKPDISASVSGVISCQNSSVRLQGTSKTPGVSFEWKGPGGYYSTSPNTVTAMPGEYVLTARDPVNNRISSAIVNVLMDTITPKSIDAEVSGMLTCMDTIINLKGKSATTNVSFNWSGPKDYNATSQNCAVSNPGIYHLKVTDLKNGCSSHANAMVEQNIVQPRGVIASVSDVLTCNKTTVTVEGSSLTRNVKFNWSGPDFKSTENRFSVSIPGAYLLTVSDQQNGCKSYAKIIVKQNIAPPAKVLTISDTITCKKDYAVIKALASRQDVTYNWSGPNNLISTDSIIKVQNPGTYKVNITNRENGCSVFKYVTVHRDTVSPVVSVFPSREITCMHKSVTFNGLEKLKGHNYNWKGPGSFFSTVQNPEVSFSGEYNVTVTNPANGCSVEKIVNVKENLTIPENLQAAVSNIVSCEKKALLIASSSSMKTLFEWNGPGGFISDKKEPEISKPGIYKLTGTNPLNGCKSYAEVAVQGEECAKGLK